jgi:hypothetical protein
MRQEEKMFLYETLEIEKWKIGVERAIPGLVYFVD